MFTSIKTTGQSIFSFAKRRKYTTALIVALLLVGIISLASSFSAPLVTEEVAADPLVEVQTVRDLASDSLFTAIGTVEAVSEARLQTESSGRVTGVYAEIGDLVQAGSILVALENNSERAALLQAEGSYEAAQAAAAQSTIGTKEAEIRLGDAYRALAQASEATYGIVKDVLINDVDPYYANPDTAYPTLRLTTEMSTDFLSGERITLQTSLTTWANFSFTNQNNTALYAHADFAKQEITRVLSLVDIFRTAINDSKNKDRYTEAERATLNTDLTGARAQLVAAQNTIDSAKSGLKTAIEGVERAEISATGGVTSAANAQLKQALGSYRAAQANFEKTIIRTPITGVVNALYLKTGEYVSASAAAAIVANNNGLEITTSVAEADAFKLALGDVVTIDKIATGTISAIAGAIDPTTGKVALKIAVSKTDTITNGTTVSILFAPELVESNSTITIPLSAVKITGSGPVVFEVVDNKLEAIAVVLGPVSGNTVLITEGVTLETKIVVDARGLKAGQSVTTTSK